MKIKFHERIETDKEVVIKYKNTGYVYGAILLLLILSYFKLSQLIMMPIFIASFALYFLMLTELLPIRREIYAARYNKRLTIEGKFFSFKTPRSFRIRK